MTCTYKKRIMVSFIQKFRVFIRNMNLTLVLTIFTRTQENLTVQEYSIISVMSTKKF